MTIPRIHHSTRPASFIVVSSVLVGATAGSALAQPSTAGPGGPGTVLSHQKISDTEGGFTGTLDDSDFFGRWDACE
ncbi:MAG: hypothetical protein IH983_08900 [Planctomycetes bacterium]|nr:hypothetical protein [Planctomycetota bacterium]